LECSFSEVRASLGRLRPFLEQLVAAGLCTDAKRDGVLGWMRAFHERTEPERWPADLRAEARRRGDCISMMLRWPYHVKLVYEDSAFSAAKAYLAVRQSWPTPAQLRQMVGEERVEA